MKSAIVIQCFAKADTLEALCESLLRCNGRENFDLIFWSDSSVGARKEADYRPKAEQVQRVLWTFAEKNRDQFRSISIRGNTTNRGTCKTCQIALDSAFEDYEFAIFSEDDTIFSKDALDWFVAISQTDDFLNDDTWAIAGESIFFDGHKLVPDGRLIKAAIDYARNNALWAKFTSFGFVPSTCFATNRRKWAEISETRGRPRGDEDLCHRCTLEDKKCLFPIVSRVKDVGMLHPDGYSVSIHSMENVKSIKNCYLLSEDVFPDAETLPRFSRFDGDAGQLYSRSTLLKGFDDTISGRSSLLMEARGAAAAADWEGALKSWRELKSHGPSTLEVNNGLSLSLLKTGNRTEARQTILGVLETHPNEAFSQSILAYILEADREFAEAEAIWTKVSDRADVPQWLRSNATNGMARCHARLLRA